jgi:tryptophanyl-tRNA synthetase
MAATEEEPATRTRIFSGIQPTGRKTLGNYSGGFRQYVQTQATGDGFFCIVDLHSITVDYDPTELRRSTLDLAALLFAAGLDAERSTVFCQSHVTAHAEAAWLLAAVTGYGQLGRMTQFKDKSEHHEFISAGLFTYPVLMAGDILLYQTDVVPIGDDQRQHLELARDVAERFNHRYGETFRVPDGQFPDIGGRIMDLQQPTRKMSTTMSSEQGAVYIADSPDAIRKKFKTAVTDSEREIRYDPAVKPGVSNLLEIMSVATGEPIAALEQRFDGSGYGDLKEAVGESVVALLSPIQERFQALRGDERELQRLLAVGAEKARRVCEPTLDVMYDRMGFVRSESGRFFGAARPRGL